MLRKAIPALLLVWCALSLAVEMESALEGWDLQETSPRRPAAWRFGTPQLARMADCLDDVRARVPRGSVIAFASPSGPDAASERSAFFRSLWAAYLLPEHDVLPIDDPSAPRLAEYAVDFRAGLDLPRLELVAQLRGCRLFKVR